MSPVPNTAVTPASKDAVARALAKAHRDTDPAITGVYRIESSSKEGDPSEPVKVLEINPNTTISGIMPVKLGAHPPSGILVPSVVVEIHPSEVDAIISQTLKLPLDWRVDFSKPLI